MSFNFWTIQHSTMFRNLEKASGLTKTRLSIRLDLYIGDNWFIPSLSDA